MGFIPFSRSSGGGGSVGVSVCGGGLCLFLLLPLLLNESIQAVHQEFIFVCSEPKVTWWSLLGVLWFFAGCTKNNTTLYLANIILINHIKNLLII